jgi:hypothetical protein
MKQYLVGIVTLSLVLSTISPTPAAAASSWLDDDRSYETDRMTEETIASYIRQLERLLEQLQALEASQRSTRWQPRSSGGLSEVSVTTRGVDDVDGERATLRGRVDFGNSDEAVVYFRWGTSPQRLTNETPNIVLDERDSGSFSARIDDLDENRRYYYQARAEDDRGRIDYGSIASFRSDDDRRDDDDDWDDRDNDEEPRVETLRAGTIRTTSAELRGEVAMNDFEDGYVFLVYGEDEDSVDDVADEYDDYGAIDTDGDDLQKTAIYSGLNTSRSFWISIGGLDEDTDIYYAYCVEYEDAGGDNTITCGDTESFTTDED